MATISAELSAEFSLFPYDDVLAEYLDSLPAARDQNRTIGVHGNARAATQVFGGYGFMNEFPVARFYRDAKVLEIGEGTSEVQRMLISREMGLR